MKVPGPVESSAAWSGLPVSLGDHIGFIAFDMVFHGFLPDQAYAPEDYVLPSDEARGEAYDRECKGLKELYRNIEDAVPDLFGPARRACCLGRSPMQPIAKIERPHRAGDAALRGPDR